MSALLRNALLLELFALLPASGTVVVVLMNFESLLSS